MRSQSTVFPESIQITSLGRKCRVRLRKNIEQVTREEGQLYQYDEVVFELDNRPNLRSDIERNFEAYFAYGEQYMKKQREEQEKEREIDRLFRRKQQVDENRMLAQQLIDRELDAIMLAQQLVELELQLLEVKMK